MSQSLARPLAPTVFQHLRSRFVAGLLVIVPIGITYWILSLIFAGIDNLVGPALEQALGVTVPGLGVVALLLLVYLTGLLVSNFIGQWLVRAGQRALLRLPVIGSVYEPVKQLMDGFAGTTTSGFKRVVAIEYPRKGSWTLAFLTGVTRNETGQPMAITYIPSSPTPYSGWMSILPMDEVYDTNLSVSEAMRLVVSGGIAAPPRINKIAINPAA